MDGFVNLLKPPGMTSSDAVLFVRRLLPRGTRVGHLGTLDPDAAGVLPVSVGKATRLFDYAVDGGKEYIAEALFGIRTDTQDVQGKVLTREQASVRPEDIQSLLPRLTGTIDQIPPAYSALQQNGRRLYDLAREGAAIDIAPRKARVGAFELLEQTRPDRYLFRIECGKGVYIRTLIHDLGNLLGCGAAMSFLLRTRSGVFGLEEAHTVEELADCADWDRILLPMDAPVAFMPRVDVGADYEKRARCGNPFPADTADKTGFVRVYLGGAFAGIGEAAEDETIRFRAMLLREKAE